MILYKYLPAERIDVLVSACIRYTQPGALNDPFEARPHVAAIAPRDESIRKLREVAPSEISAGYEALPMDIRLKVSFEKYKQLATDLFEAKKPDIVNAFNQFASVVNEQMPDKLNDLLGILSLTEDRTSLLMWSHYACSHSGFVIGFNSKHAHFEERRGPKDEMRHLRQVEYREERPSMPLSQFDGVDVFLVKSSHWAYEREWRIMRALQDASERVDDCGTAHPVHLFAFPPSAVVEVVLGARMAEANREKLLNLVLSDSRYMHVRVHEARPHESLFRIVLRELE